MKPELKTHHDSSVSIPESARQIGISPATVRNWVKTGYLKINGTGDILEDSILTIQGLGEDTKKLTSRANKTKKDAHDHKQVASEILKHIKKKSTDPELLGQEYENRLSESFRNIEGIFYTPKEVIQNLFLSLKKDIDSAIICDPCCGTGNFLIEALKIGFKTENIYGFDTDSVAVEIAKERIFRFSGIKSENIKNIDFLSYAANHETHNYDYIFTNPPWGKKMPKEQRENLGQVFSSGSATDTCSLFFFACLKNLKENGELGLVLPEAFFNISTFEDARKKALEHTIERFIDYGKAFKGLITKTQGIVLRKTALNSKNQIICEAHNTKKYRTQKSFLKNPKTIINHTCGQDEADTLDYLFQLPCIKLKGNAKWGLGIVTGNNSKHVLATPKEGYIPVYKGSDISCHQLKPATSFVQPDFSKFQQVAPKELFLVKEKLIYKFISSRLIFFFDDKQRFVLNSANFLIPDTSFPLKTKVLGELLSSDFMNWVFAKTFNTHKVLRGDLESLPLFSQYLENISSFNEDVYLSKIKIEKKKNGAYGIKK